MQGSKMCKGWTGSSYAWKDLELAHGGVHEDKLSKTLWGLARPCFKVGGSLQKVLKATWHTSCTSWHTGACQNLMECVCSFMGQLLSFLSTQNVGHLLIQCNLVRQTNPMISHATDKQTQWLAMQAHMLYTITKHCAIRFDKCKPHSKLTFITDMRQ